MAKKMGKRGKSLFAGYVFLFAALLSTVSAFITFSITESTLDKAIKIGTPVLLLVAAAIQILTASRLPQDTES
jgi:hypothetical protein